MLPLLCYSQSLNHCHLALQEEYAQLRSEYMAEGKVTLDPLAAAERAICVPANHCAVPPTMGAPHDLAPFLITGLRSGVQYHRREEFRGDADIQGSA